MDARFLRWRGMRLAPGIAALALAILFSGCARRPRLPPRPFPGYAGRVDSLVVDRAALAGRRIAIDPGHGGFFRGVVGRQGLAEAEVNLGVALELRDLLARHGAEVFLTRETDRDFLSPADSALRSDLAERTRRANAFRPDLFVSIHHNAEPAGRRDVNETQTYYKLGDDGPSLDAGVEIHRALVRNVGIARNQVLPGNYFVLRSCEAPAVLTETSHLSDPDVEALLGRPDKRRIEAEALFLGIARWLARPRPVIEFLAAVGAGGRADTAFAEGGEPRIEARIAGEFDEATLALDGVSVPLARDGPALSWRPSAPLAAGRHEAVLAARLAGVGAARPARLRFDVLRPAVRLRAEARHALEPGSRARVVALRIEALDRFGVPSPDSLVLRVRRTAGSDVAPPETLVVARDGVAWATLKLPPAGAARAGRGAGAAARGPARCRVELASAPGSGAASRAIPIPPVEIALDPPDAGAPGLGPAGGSGPWACVALRLPEGVPLEEAPGTREPAPALTWLRRDGFARVVLDTAGRAVAPAPAGFRAWPADSPLPPRFTAIAGGALHGRRIVLDPEGGADDDAGTGPGGTRAATLNLETARALAGMLRAAGAEVTLTRNGEIALSEIERVQVAEAFRPDRVLRIGHRAGPPRLGHYFSSAPGRRWAERVTGELARMGLPAAPVAEDPQYVLQQSSAVALYASPARVDRDESRLTAPGTLRAEACALFLALAREWATGPEWAADSLEVRDDDGRPLSGVPVRIGGLLLQSDARGQVRFARTEPGPLEVEIAIRDGVARHVLLDSEHGVVLTGPLSR